jgi:HK97 family phage prohead protease
VKHDHEDFGRLEQRYAPARVEVDARTDRLIRGEAIVFNTLSRLMVDRTIGKFRERIHPDAVDRTLRSGQVVKAYWNHDTNEVLGSTKSGTLVLRKGRSGLGIEIDPPQWADRYIESIRRGDVDGMSFGFAIPTADGEVWDFRAADGIPIREVRDMIFNDVSIVPCPAYEHTQVELSKRSLDMCMEAMGVEKYDWRQKWHDINTIRYGR